MGASPWGPAGPVLDQLLARALQKQSSGCERNVPAPPCVCETPQGEMPPCHQQVALCKPQCPRVLQAGRA